MHGLSLSDLSILVLHEYEQHNHKTNWLHMVGGYGSIPNNTTMVGIVVLTKIYMLGNGKNRCYFLHPETACTIIIGPRELVY